MAGITVIIRLETKGNPIFVQERVGRGWGPFKLYKFRSMYVNHDDRSYWDMLSKYAKGDLPVFRSVDGRDMYKQINSGNVTKVGKWLRKSNLDELPQLLNIALGQMVFIGPRPLPSSIISEIKPYYFGRFSVLPGITGLAQVSDRRSLSFEESLVLDCRYKKRQSIGLDTKILFKTLVILISGKQGG